MNRLLKVIGPVRRSIGSVVERNDSTRYTRKHVWIDFCSGLGGVTPYIISRKDMQGNHARPFFRAKSVLLSGPHTPIGSIVLRGEVMKGSREDISRPVHSPVSGCVRSLPSIIWIEDFDQALFQMDIYDHDGLMTYGGYNSYMGHL